MSITSLIVWNDMHLTLKYTNLWQTWFFVTIALFYVIALRYMLFLCQHMRLYVVLSVGIFACVHLWIFSTITNVHICDMWVCVCASNSLGLCIYDRSLWFPTTPHTPPMWWPCPHYPLLQWLYGGRLVALKVGWQRKNNIELQAGTFGVWNTFSCRNQKPTPSNLTGNMMIIRVLPIHVPPCYDGGIP